MGERRLQRSLSPVTNNYRELVPIGRIVRSQSLPSVPSSRGVSSNERSTLPLRPLPLEEFVTPSFLGRSASYPAAIPNTIQYQWNQEHNDPTTSSDNGVAAGHSQETVCKTGMLDEYFESMRLEEIDHEDSVPSTITQGNQPLHPSSSSQYNEDQHQLRILHENVVQMFEELDLQSLRHDLARYVDKKGNLIHDPSQLNVSPSPMHKRHPTSPASVSYSPTISEDQRNNWIEQPVVYACHHCNILFDDDILHYMHMQAHSRVSPFTCRCGYFNNTKYQFHAHIFTSVHSFILPKGDNSPPSSYLGYPPVPSIERAAWLARAILYECSFCTILFEDKILHNIHMQAHKKGHFYKCICGYNGELSKYLFLTHFMNVEHFVSEESLFGISLPKK